MRFKWTRTASGKLLWHTLGGDTAAAVARRLGCAERTVQAMQIKLRLKQVLGDRGQRRPLQVRQHFLKPVT